MEYETENLFRFASPDDWLCSIHEIDGKGNITIIVTENPPSRSRLQIIIKNVVYYDSHMAWKGCCVNIASQKKLTKYREFIDYMKTAEESIKFYVISTTGTDNIFLAHDIVISGLLP